MTPRRSIFVAALLLVLGASPARALDLSFAQDDAGQAGAFLDFAASARSQGMGFAHTAVADDAGAIYWNPAGLSQIKRNDIVTMYSNLHLDSAYGFFGYAQPAANFGTFGLGAVILRSDDFDRRAANREDLGSFGLNQSAFLLSHGVRINPYWSYGTTLKAAREKIDSSADTGFGMDTGFIFHIRPHIQAAFAVKNLVAPKLKLRDDSDSYARDFRLGAKWAVNDNWLVAADLNKTEDRSLKINLVGEWAIHEILALRAGLNETELTAGLGVKMGDLDLDYAFGFNSAGAGDDNLGGSHRFGIHIAFGKNIYAEEQGLMWQKKGQDILSKLQEYMDEDRIPVSDDVKAVAQQANEVVQMKGFPDPKDLYAAQGYIYFFQQKYERSVYYLGEAISLAQEDREMLQRHHVKAQTFYKQAERYTFVRSELESAKAAFEIGDLRTAKEACERVLDVEPNNVEAITYLEDIRKRFNEPIERALKIARRSMERSQYLSAIRYLNDVQKLDPANKEARELMKRAIESLENAQNELGTQRYVEEVVLDAEKSKEFYSKGLQLYSKGFLSNALKAFENAVRYNADNKAARHAYNRVVAELKEQKRP